MNPDPSTLPRAGRFATRFDHFYREHFLAEHRHPANVALHIAGTVASAALVAWAIASSSWVWLLLYPVVHAVPGLLGHRLFERSAAVGDLRVMRTDFPAWWFILANHRLSFERVFARRPRPGQGR